MDLRRIVKVAQIKEASHYYLTNILFHPDSIFIKQRSSLETGKIVILQYKRIDICGNAKYSAALFYCSYLQLRLYNGVIS